MSNWETVFIGLSPEITLQQLMHLVTKARTAKIIVTRRGGFVAQVLCAASNVEPQDDIISN